jgi:hypothetical protein
VTLYATLERALIAMSDEAPVVESDALRSAVRVRAKSVESRSRETGINSTNIAETENWDGERRRKRCDCSGKRRTWSLRATR